MAEPGPSEPVSRNTPQEEEKFFLELFTTAFALITEDRVPSFETTTAIDRIIKRFKNGLANACGVPYFSTHADLSGYFYRYSPLSASVTRNKTVFAIRNCQEFLSCFQQPSVKVVSVGGGTGSDLVGLYSALYEVNCGFQNMEITLMDSNIGWEPFQRAVEFILRLNESVVESQLIRADERQLFKGKASELIKKNVSELIRGNASQLFKNKVIKTSFICTDCINMTPDEWLVLNQANIVWMKGLLSILENNDQRKSITRNIISAMTPGALLVVFDCSSFAPKPANFGYRLESILNGSSQRDYTLDNTEPVIAKQTTQDIFIFKIA